MEIRSINIIKNNDKNIEIINDHIQKTLNASTIDCKYNKEKSDEVSNGFILTFKSKKGKVSDHLYQVNLIDMNNSINLMQFYIQLKWLCDSSAKKIPFLETSYGIEVDKKDWEYKYEKYWKEKMYSIIYNLVYYSWGEYNLKDVMDMAVSIFIRFSQSQILENGNKRFTVLFTTAFLAYFNIYIFSSWNHMANDYLKKWEPLATIAATRYYQKRSSDGYLENDLDQTNGEQISEDVLISIVREYLENVSFFKIF